MRSSFSSSSLEAAIYRSGESLSAVHSFQAPSIDSTQGLSGIGLLMQQVRKCFDNFEAVITYFECRTMEQDPQFLLKALYLEGLVIEMASVVLGIL